VVVWKEHYILGVGEETKKILWENLREERGVNDCWSLLTSLLFIIKVEAPDLDIEARWCLGVEIYLDR